MSREHPDSADVLAGRLRQRAALAGLDLPPALALRLGAYVRLVQRWNARINLTALGADDHGLDRLVIEPLAAARHVKCAAVGLIDIGSGSGSPGIPLRLALGPGVLVLVESRERKAAFLREAVRRLELEAASVVCGRFEELAARPHLARVSHQGSAAAADPLAVAGRTPSRRFDVVTTTPAASLSPRDPPQRRLDALATNPGEICGLEGAFDLLTVRGVRLGRRQLQRMAALVAPAGELFLFGSAAGAPAPEDLPAPLELRDTYPLVASLRSRLAVLGKASDPERISGE